MKIKKLCRKKRFLAFLLAMLLFCPPILDIFYFIPEKVEAATVSVSQQGGNLLKANTDNFYGHDSGGGIFIWRDNKGMPVFCAQPGKSMNSGTGMSVEWHKLTDDWGSIEMDVYDKELLWYALAAAGCGKEGKTNISAAEYILVQCAVWAITSGEWTTVEDFRANMDVIIRNIKDGDNKEAIINELNRRLDSYVTTVNHLAGDESIYVPDFTSKYLESRKQYKMQNMGDGIFQFTGKSVKDMVYMDASTGEIPVGWTIQYDGENVVFICDSKLGGTPQAMIKGVPKPGSGIASLPKPDTLGILLPANNSKQIMIAQVEGEPWSCYVEFIGGKPEVPVGEGSYDIEVHRYNHEEVFRSNYNIELEKRDAETGNQLADTKFDILEAFDFSQLSGTGLERRQFSKESNVLVPHVQLTTNEKGQLSHSDTKSYRYEMTYCGGHPDPKIEYAASIEAETDDPDEQEAIDAANALIAEKNRQLEQEAWEKWREEVHLCEEVCDFHSELEGEAEKRMRSHRDRLWNQFINLKHTYTVQEVAARNGYTIHDYHPNDTAVDIISMASSQAGGEGEVIGSYYKGVASITFAALAMGRGDALSGRSGDWEESEVNPINQGRYEKGKIGFIFRIANHRSEGEIHINKRDLELYQILMNENSYGKAQGDATLEGAVYGLYAAEDILHPDGITGKVFSAGDLVSVGSTDQEGNASFVVITEQSETSMRASNLYTGKEQYGSPYPDYAAENGNPWIGRPLLMGSYYVQEISRSEGYELSKYGIDLTESNRQGDAFVISEAGSAAVTDLSHRHNEWDGSWNDIRVRYFKTENGFDVHVNGYPSGSTFYQITGENVEVTNPIVTSIEEQPKTDENGAIIYQTAAGGEYKYGPDGKPVQKTDAEGNLVYDYSLPYKETVTVTERFGVYKDLSIASGSDAEYADLFDPDYVTLEVNRILQEKGFKTLGNEAPAWVLPLPECETNEAAMQVIIEVLKQDAFWDSYVLEEIYSETTGAGTSDDPLITQYFAVIRYGYTLIKNRTNFYDPLTKRVILRRNCQYERDGQLIDGECYLIYQTGEYEKTGNKVTINRGTIKNPVIFGAIPIIEVDYGAVFDQYTAGEQILDEHGNPIPEMIEVYTYGTETIIEYKETWNQIPATDISYDPTAGTYILHFDNTIDWADITEALIMTIRAKAPTDRFADMPYADYILRNGGNASAVTVKHKQETGSYRVYVDLFYPGQFVAWQDAGTREKPLIVLQRVIKQAVKVIKDISKQSYDRRNTYSLHKDAFTVLYGGYHGREPAKSLPGFHFKIYRLADLEDTGKLLKKANGSYDYKSFFENKQNQSFHDTLAIDWDNPKYDVDQDLTTLHANRRGDGNYYGDSVMLPYGTYVIVEQIPVELINKHYQIEEPKEIELPFVPEIDEDGQIHDIAAREYFYDADMSPEDLEAKYMIRFNEETHVIQANNRDGSFPVYKYGLSKGVKPDSYPNPAVAIYYKWNSNAENGSRLNQVYYDILVDQNGNTIDYGVTLDQVPAMTGISTAVHRKYAKALVPWTILDPRFGEVINDEGDIGNRDTGLDSDGKFNFIAFAKKGFENELYSTGIRIEKIDSETGENIIHEGAYFKIYAAARDVKGDGGTGINGTGKIIFDENGIPVYDEKEQIILHDRTGAEVGVFRAYTTIQEVVTPEGIQKQPVGYIELPEPLGAGVYVLVEIAAPPGYIKSPPIAFEVYSDEVAYYYDGNPDDRRPAEQFQYVTPLSDQLRTVSRMTVEDRPTHVEIHKTEEGTDTITFEVRGSKALLEARGDIENLQYDPVLEEWYGTVTKTYDEWSENIITGTEEELKGMEHVKPLYDKDGNFLGKGIRFEIYVQDATLTLYQGLEIKKFFGGNYLGVTVSYENGKVDRITASGTGTHTEITTKEKDETPAKNNIYDAEDIQNSPIDLLFYDLEQVPTRLDEETGDLYLLDEAGNDICCLDPQTGMAYVKDDYGRLIAYPVDTDGQRIISQSIQIRIDEDGQQRIYTDTRSIDDENNLPIYYESGEITRVDDQWVTTEEPHEIFRLPVGAYILEETRVPSEQGYIQPKHIGIRLAETDSKQAFFLENDFTKLQLAKVDITTKEEIPDAVMTLYQAIRVPDDSSRGWHLEAALDELGNKKVWTSWISGYEYDDNGNLKRDAAGDKIPTTEPHWVDHIPVGDYILEETVVPYHYGYVQSEAIEVIVKESGVVQNFLMEDDYTSLEIIKMDPYKEEVLIGAELALYHAKLDAAGMPVRDEHGVVQIDQGREQDGLILSWQTQDGSAVASTAYPVTDPDTGRLVFDPETGEPVIGYRYDIQPIPTILRGQYYITETGAVHFDYLPVGYYVLREEDTPTGYATAAPMLIEVKEIGGHTEVQKYQMDDIPLTVEVTKNSLAGEKLVAGATLRIYEADKQGGLAVKPAVDEDGNQLPEMIYDPAYLKYEWITGNDGVYSEGDDLPSGFVMGDLKPHLIQYIPLGDYYLVEAKTPYGFLTAEPVPFTIKDTPDRQYVEMTDKIPDGQVLLTKSDEWTNEKLAGAVFLLKNKTLDQTVESLITGPDGTIQSNLHPIGFLGADGRFQPYTYTITEADAPDDYMLNPYIHEFQFIYEDGKTPLISYTYDAANQPNQVKISKQTLIGQQELPGAHMQLERICTEIDEMTGAEKEVFELYETWISGEQPHYITGIPTGKYRLTEVKTPGEGYGFAEPIIFEITENMIVIPEVTMYDEHTTTIIEKLVGNSNKQLAGAKLQITRAKDGALILVFVTTGEPYTITGLEPGEYLLTELEAPSGYQIAKPIKFTVGADFKATVVRMIDYLKSKPGGKEPEKAYIEKQDISTGAPLADAWILIKDPNGSVYAKGKTDHYGKFYFEKPSLPGRYTYQEMEAPKDYYLNQTIFSFQVNADGTITGDRTIKDVRKEDHTIIKKDITNQQELPGAVIAIYNDSGLKIFEGMTNGEGRLFFTPPAPGTYTFKELKAPPRYQLNETVYTFQVHDDGTITGDSILYNEPQIGIITASYDQGDGSGRVGLKEDQTGKVPATSDRQSMSVIILLLLLLTALMVLIFSGKKHWRSKIGCILLILILGIGTFSLISHAEEGNNQTITKTEEYITNDIRDCRHTHPETLEEEGREYRLAAVIYEASINHLEYQKQENIPAGNDVMTMTKILLEDPGETIRFEDTYVDDTGDRYYLQDSIVEEVSGGPQKEAMESTVQYVGVGKNESLPEELEIEITDAAGNLRKEKLFFARCDYYNPRWRADFQFPITFHQYDAGRYRLGNYTIEENTQIPALAGYEEELLKQIGVAPEEYQIDYFSWDGESYAENDQIIKRNATAYGRRQIYDCSAIYQGEIQSETANNQYLLKGIYVKETPAQAGHMDLSYKMKAAGIYELSDASPSKPSADYPYQQLKSFPIIKAVESISLTGLLFLIIYLFWLLKKASKELSN